MSALFLFNNKSMAKAKIIIAKAGKLSPSDLDALRRCANMLREHQLSVKIEFKVKKTLKLVHAAS